MDAPVTSILLLIIVAISLLGFQSPLLKERLMMQPYQIFHCKQFYRLISSGFAHANHTHLLFNVVTFYFFGISVETTFVALYEVAGNFYFILLFLSAVTASDIPTAIKYRNSTSYSSLGASGGVSAIVFTSILFTPLADIYLIFVPIPIPGFILGTLYIIYSYYQSKTSNDNINHAAHLHGALFGIIFSVFIEPTVIPDFIQKVSQWRLY